MYSKAPNMMGGVQRSSSISFIRLISLLLIITCHIMQYLGIELAWWFNVGVQIFFCISGYLYGKQDKREVTRYLRDRFVKILVPYYIVFLFVALLEIVFERASFSASHFLLGLLLRGTLAGGEHLWFIPYILLCYVITPLLHCFRDRYVSDEKSCWRFSIIAVFIVSIFFGLFDRYYNPAWISCYVIGYCLGVNDKGKHINNRRVMFLFSLLMSVGNGIQIYCDYVSRNTFSGNVEIVYGYFKNYNHVWLGVFIFMVLRALLDHIGIQKSGFLDVSDKYSYEIYLVHQFLILGPFSLMMITPWVSVNIVIIFIGIVTAAWFLKKAEVLVLKWLRE